jgi:hypothetical protein
MTMTYDTYLRRVCVTCITIIDKIILTNYTNNAYYSDTYLAVGPSSTRGCTTYICIK